MTDDSATVAQFLRGNPAFLAERPDLYRALEPPARVHGEALADHMAAMLDRERAHARTMQTQAETVLASGRAAASIQDRVQQAVLAAIAAIDTGDFVTDALPALLGLDAAALCGEHAMPRWRTLPRGSIATLLGGRAILFRDRPEDAALLHAEAAELATRDVLVRVPAGRPALLALVSRDPFALPDPAASPALVFLARVLGALIAR